MQKNKITIYTDGSAKGNPGRAGWGVVLFIEGKIYEIGGKEKYATNNQMELTAVIEALKYLKNKSSQLGFMGVIEIFSDSKYVILGITEWINSWIKNDWRNSAKKIVLNSKLWKELHALNKEFKIKWIYVEGHNGDKWNERADAIATSFADGKPVI
jgi:ribonuclease HI